MIFTCFDLEADQPAGELISIGAVQGLLPEGEILAEMEVFIKIGHPLNPFITKLTGITDQRLEEEGISLVDAYRKLRDFHTQGGAFVNPICWGRDAEDLYQATKGLIDPGEWCFGRRIEDCKVFYRAIALKRGMNLRGGLARVMTRFGMTFKGTKHEAKADSRNTFLLYARLLQEIK